WPDSASSARNSCSTISPPTLTRPACAPPPSAWSSQSRGSAPFSGRWLRACCSKSTRAQRPCSSRSDYRRLPRGPSSCSRGGPQRSRRGQRVPRLHCRRLSGRNDQVIPHPEARAERASKDERPRCCSRAVALRGSLRERFRVTVQKVHELSGVTVQVWSAVGPAHSRLRHLQLLRRRRVFRKALQHRLDLGLDHQHFDIALGDEAFRDRQGPAFAPSGCLKIESGLLSTRPLRVRSPRG